MTGPRSNLDRGAIDQVPSQPRTFADFDLVAAWRYDAWYETAAGRRIASAEGELFADLLGFFPNTHSVLEVGCGTGHFSRWLAQPGMQVVGLDESAAMLAVALERGGGPRYVLGSAEKLPFPDQSVDLVAFVTSLEFIRQPWAAVREAGRVARHGLLLGILNAISPTAFVRRARGLLFRTPYQSARFYTPWSLASVVRASLPERVRGVVWRTVGWPSWMPGAARRLPFGAFIGAAVPLCPPLYQGRGRSANERTPLSSRPHW